MDVEQHVDAMAAWVAQHGIEAGVMRLEGQRGAVEAFAIAEALADAGADERRVYGLLFFGNH